jgi:uncharacterized glyoxalase superfamily protein PhnB
LKPNRSIPDVSVIPVLRYADVSQAADWLVGVFGFRVRLRIGSHRIQFDYLNGALVVAEGSGDGSDDRSAVLLRVANLDEVHQRALARGATTLQPPMDHPYGERQCTIRDPGGHAWTLSETLRDSDPKDWGGQLADPG